MTVYQFLDGLRVETREGLPENYIGFYTPGVIDHIETSFSETDDKGNVVVTAKVFYRKPPQVVTLNLGGSLPAADPTPDTDVLAADGESEGRE